MSEPGLNPVAPTSAAILVVEDDPDLAALLHGSLAKLGGPVQVVASAAGATEALALAVPSLIVLDLVLPDADGRNLLASWRSTPATATVPVIALTVSGTAEVGNQCRALGVSDFLEKPVGPAAVADAARRLLSEAAAAGEASIDPLTGVANRAALCRAYEDPSAGLAPGGLLSVAMIDIDRFRAINETCGRSTADAVLREIADLIRMSTASGQLVGRWQGDQFMAFFPGVEQRQAVNWLERLLESLRAHAFSNNQGGTFHVTFSAGVVEAQPGASADETVAAVLGRLYLAKEAGRACVVSGETEVEAPETTVLLADDDDIVAVIVRTTLEAQGMVVERYRDGATAFEAAQKKPIGLFLLDVNMPGMGGFELLARLRAQPAHARVPVAMITSAGDEESVERAMALGADDYLVKPLSSHELIARVQRLLTRWVERRLHELQGSELYMHGIDLLHQVFDKVRAEEPLPVRDLSILTSRIVEDLKTRPGKLVGQVMNPVVVHGDSLAQHSLNSAILATIVGQELDIDGNDLDWLCVAAMLHEVGCLQLPDGLLQKTGDLAEKERKLLERRPELSHEIITRLAPEYAEAAEIALQAHERPDGTGYPKGLSGGQISLEAQILGAVDVFEALTHARPYRDSFQTASEAVKYLLGPSGPRFLDRVLKALIAKIGLYPVGSYVGLSTDEIALVLEHRESNPMRPLLAVVTDRSGKLLKTPRITDPMLNPQINIKSSVPPPEIRAQG